MLLDLRGVCTRRLCSASRPALNPAQRRSHSASSEAGPPGPCAAAGLDQLFADGPLLTLERSCGARAGHDTGLWATGAFGAGVYPDLPLATTWPALLRKLAPPWGGSAPAEPGTPDAVRSPGGWVVATVAAQLRSRAALEARLLQRAGVGPGGKHAAGAAADALLLVSGSHPLRDLLAPAKLVPGALDALTAAAGLRATGRLPPDLTLWAVANPLTERADRVAAKVECGAEVIVTQPPLIWPRFEAWLDEVNTRGLSHEARIVVGLPMLTSASAFAFWLDLCRAGSMPGAAAALRDFHEADAVGSGPAYCRCFTAELAQKVLGLPGVAGLHVMPVTKRGRSMAQSLVDERVLCTQPAKMGRAEPPARGEPGSAARAAVAVP